jgi:hypothetical protein
MLFHGDRIGREMTETRANERAQSKDSNAKASVLVAEGGVTRIDTYPDSLVATVKSSDPMRGEYVVAIDDYEGGINADCNCPNPRPGDCKHITAVLLALREIWLAYNNDRVTVKYNRILKYKHMKEQVAIEIGDETVRGVPLLHLLWAVGHLTSEERWKWLEDVKDKADRYPPYYVDHKARREGVYPGNAGSAEKNMIVFTEIPPAPERVDTAGKQKV